MTRRVLFAILSIAYVVAGSTADVRHGSAQNGARRDSLVYDVSAGRSTIKDIGGEKVLELTDGVTIIHGDITINAMRGINYNQRRLTHLVGDVVINQGTLTMWGDEGDYRRNSEVTTLRRNVRIVDEGWEVTCDVARYSRATGHAWLTGNVVAKDSSSTLRADSLFYDRNTELSEAFGRVEVSNPEEGFIVRGRHGFYFRDRGEGVVDRDPRLVVDPDTKEPVIVDSDTMRVFPDSARALAYYRVKIIKGNTVTQCDSAVIYDNEQRVELYGSPLAKENNVTMDGNKMFLHYDDEAVHRIDIHGAAGISEAQPDSLVIGRDSWIKGDSISLYLHNNSVDSIRVINSAISEYYPSTPGKIESNQIRGDRMFFQFDHDSLSYVRVEGRADGVYKYVDIETGKTTDSLRAVYDTTLTYTPFEETAEKVVYSAESIEYYAAGNDLVLNKSATLKYRQSTLTGSDITYYSRYDLLDATGEPQLSDAGQKFYGERMNYDLVGEAGLVVDGSTKFGEGYYTGEHVAKVGENEMKVWNSIYTTCDLKNPHFHFSSKEMKVYNKDKVVSGSMWLYVGKTPIFYLPFLANNLDRGRQSGFLRPDIEVGISSSEGRFVRNIGYFWATNDYTDFTFVGDFNENSSFRGFIRNRYKLRYQFDGNVNFNFFRDFRDYTNRWEVRGAHNQTLGEKFTLAATGHFVSDEQALSSINTIDQVDRVIDRSIRSNVSLRKSWETVGFSASASRTENLSVTQPTAVRLDATFPSVTLSIPSRNLFFGEESKEGEAGILERVLTSTRYSPRLSGDRKIRRTGLENREIITINQGLGLSSPQKVKFLNITPGMSISNTTTRTDLEIFAFEEEQIDTSMVPPDTSNVVIPTVRTADTENDFRWSASMGASTNLYGTFYPNVGKLRGIRHKITPSATYSFTPSRGSRPRSQSVRVSLQNTLDLKVASGEPSQEAAGGDVAATDENTGGGEEDLRKLSNVLLWSMSASANPDAEGRNWSNVSSNINMSLYGMNLSWSQTIDPYEREVLSSSASTQLRFGGTHPFGKSSDVDLRELNVVAASDTTGGAREGADSPVTIEQTGDRPDEPVDQLALEEGRLPWNMSLALSYSTSLNLEPQATLRFNGSIDITKAWRVQYSTIYDIDDRILSGENISVTRDLHCWQMSFSRQKLGEEWQFYFKINLRAHPEVFYEDGRRGLGGGTIGTSTFF